MAIQNFTKRHDEAALLLAEDDISDEVIAQRVGVSRQTIANWKKDQGFAQLIETQEARLNAEMLKVPIAKRRARVKIMNDLLDKSLQVMQERADAYAEDADAHGGATGLIVKSVKQIGSGPSAQVVTEYQVDTGLAKLITSLLDQAEAQTGQKIDKHQHELTGKDGAPISHTLDFSALSDDQIDRLADLAEKKLGAA